MREKSSRSEEPKEKEIIEPKSGAFDESIISEINFDESENLTSVSIKFYSLVKNKLRKFRCRRVNSPL